ncbi:MAG: FprA family A-type flavoprotein, partial [[Eubacterium] saphenum]|nr:FprA family A-type flavoprotein [[Eubacterium] saphenum]
FGIVGKYGAQVQAVLKKAAGLDIEKILPLHGPVLTENLGYYLDTYNTWSSYGVESEGVCVAYTSVYGHTKEAALLLAEKLKAAGCPKVAVTDLARDDWAEAVEDAFRYGKLVLATTTYNADAFPTMREFIAHLVERNYQNRLIGIIENGSWAPTAAKVIKKCFENSKNITFTETIVTLKSALAPENDAQLDALVKELMQ